MKFDNETTDVLIGGYMSKDAAQAIESLARLDSISADHVLPGHGDPWTGGIQEAIRQIRQPHDSTG